MPIRDQIDDDHDHVLVDEMLKKMAALGMGRVRVRKKDRPRPSAVTSMALTEEVTPGDAGLGLVLGISQWAMCAATEAENHEVMDLYNSMAEKVNPNLACFAMTESCRWIPTGLCDDLHTRTCRQNAA